MNDFDDLDELEQELGPSLRVALRRAAARIDDAAPLLHALEDNRAEVMVVDIQSAGRTRAARRRWLLAAAAVAAAVLLVAGAVLVQQTGGDHIRTKPAGPSPSSTPVVTPPATLPGDGSSEGPLLPEGAPSTPPTSELVASITLYHKGAYRLYADGRVIWQDDTRPGPLHGYNEQRLTPEGVERVRSAFLASGLFDPAQPLSDIPCTSNFQACVRDGNHWLGEETDPQPYGDPALEAVQLFDYLRTLDATLPATEWADQQIKTYVPARIAACLRMFVAGVETPLDPSILVPRFPAPAAELLAGREPSPELARLLTPVLRRGNESLIAQGGCFEVTLDEARTLAAAFLDPPGGGTHEYWGLVIRLDPQPDPAQPDATQPDAAYILFQELLPDGVPANYFGG